MQSVEEIKNFCIKNGRKTLLLDSNLFILLIVGAIDLKYIPKCNLTSKYSAQDFDLLKKVLAHFHSEILVTPQIIAELSNLSKGGMDDGRHHHFFTTMIDKLKTCTEEHVPMINLFSSTVSFSMVPKLGFSDIGIVEAAKKKDAIILTDDLDLSVYASRSKIHSINFTHIAQLV